MNKTEKMYFKHHAEITKQFIKEQKEFLEIHDEKIVLGILKKDEKKVKQIYCEILGHDLMKYVEFKMRKRTDLEKKLLMLMVLSPAFIGYCFIVLAISLFTDIQQIYIELLAYLANAAGLVMGIYIIKNAFKQKSNINFLLGISVLLINGIFVFDYLSSVF